MDLAKDIGVTGCEKGNKTVRSKIVKELTLHNLLPLKSRTQVNIWIMNFVSFYIIIHYAYMDFERSHVDKSMSDMVTISLKL